MLKNIASVAVAATLWTGIARAEAWDLPTDMPTSNPVVHNIEQFGRDVDAATGGKLTFTVHPGGSLFKSAELKRALQMSQVSIGEMPSGILENENAIFGVDSLPLLTSSFEDAYKLWQAQKPFANAFLEGQGVRILYTMPSPPQGLFSKTEINSKADLAGKKWRAYDGLTARLGSELGAQPVTISLAELSQALTLGMVDAFPTSARTGVDMKAWETVKYFYRLDAAFPKRVVMVNIKDLEALDPAVREAVEKAAVEAETRGWKMVEEDTQKAVDVLSEHGIQVLQASETFDADLRAAAAVLQKDWEARAAAQGAELLQAYRN